MKIYTKAGDQGKTRLIGGECVDKSNPRVDCYGQVDELNCFLGAAIACLEEASEIEASSRQALHAELTRIQHELFNLGSLIACEKTEKHSEPFKKNPKILPEHYEALERSIDHMTQTLPALKNFILPGGSPLSSHLHIARSVCRRAERGLVGLLHTISPSDKELQEGLIYLNRLSDYLFTTARYSNYLVSQPDKIWTK